MNYRIKLILLLLIFCSCGGIYTLKYQIVPGGDIDNVRVLRVKLFQKCIDAIESVISPMTDSLGMQKIPNDSAGELLLIDNLLFEGPYGHVEFAYLKNMESEKYWLMVALVSWQDIYSLYIANYSKFGQPTEALWELENCIISKYRSEFGETSIVDIRDIPPIPIPNPRHLHQKPPYTAFADSITIRVL